MTVTPDRVPFHIDIDEDVCIGSATCVNSAPQVFRIDHTGRARVIAPELATLAIARDAASDCPSEAIAVVGADGTRMR